MPPPPLLQFLPDSRAAPAAQKVLLVVTESRPGFEGRVTAGGRGHGLKVTLITDACAGHELQRVDVVLMGVDSIEQDGSVINKAGSSLISMAASVRGSRCTLSVSSERYASTGSM